MWRHFVLHTVAGRHVCADTALAPRVILDDIVELKYHAAVAAMVALLESSPYARLACEHRPVHEIRRRCDRQPQCGCHMRSHQVVDGRPQHEVHHHVHDHDTGRVGPHASDVDGFQCGLRSGLLVVGLQGCTRTSAVHTGRRRQPAWPIGPVQPLPSHIAGIALSRADFDGYDSLTHPFPCPDA